MLNIITIQWGNKKHLTQPIVQREWLFIAFCLLLCLPLAGCSKSKPPVVARPEVQGVTAVVLQTETVADDFETTGTVKAQSVSSVASKVMGRVDAIAVSAGDRVRAGQVLLTLDDSDSRQKFQGAAAAYQEALRGLEIARANRELQDATYVRYKKLYDEQAIASQQLDQIVAQQKMAFQEFERARATVERTQAGREEAKAYLDYTRITAPTDGVVGERKIELGSMAVPGLPLIQVEDDSAFQVEVNVDERWLGQLRPGQNAAVTIDALGQTLPGTIREVTPTVDANSRTFLVKIRLNGNGLRTGLYAKVRINIGQKTGLFIDKTAVVEKGQLTGVYVLNSEQVVFYRMIRTGKEYNGKWEVLSGLSAGERILVTGLERAIDGGFVRDVRSP